jgi:hypothetical protein
VTCDRCLKPAIGEHGVGLCPFEARSRAAGVNPDDFIGGLALENLGHDPVVVYSRSELKRELDARGLQPFVRHVDGDKHVSSWVTMDPYTLESARILAARQAETKVRVAHDPEQYPVIETYITDSPVFTVKVYR